MRRQGRGRGQGRGQAGSLGRREGRAGRQAAWQAACMCMEGRQARLCERQKKRKAGRGSGGRQALPLSL